MRRIGPISLFGLLSFGVSAVLAYAVWKSTPPTVDELGAWAIALNIVAFVIYLYDKRIAGGGATRVPEVILLALVLFGGGLGAIVAMLLSRHKMSKSEFLMLYGLCVIGSLLLRNIYYQNIQPALGNLGL